MPFKSERQRKATMANLQRANKVRLERIYKAHGGPVSFAEALAINLRRGANGRRDRTRVAKDVVMPSDPRSALYRAHPERMDVRRVDDGKLTPLEMHEDRATGLLDRIAFLEKWQAERQATGADEVELQAREKKIKDARAAYHSLGSSAVGTERRVRAMVAREIAERETDGASLDKSRREPLPDRVIDGASKSSSNPRPAHDIKAKEHPVK